MDRWYGRVDGQCFCGWAALNLEDVFDLPDAQFYTFKFFWTYSIWCNSVKMFKVSLIAIIACFHGSVKLLKCRLDVVFYFCQFFPLTFAWEMVHVKGELDFGKNFSLISSWKCSIDMPFLDDTWFSSNLLANSVDKVSEWHDSEWKMQYDTELQNNKFAHLK